MKKKNSKKNRGALKRCFFGAGIFSLFFTCRTAAMEIGGFDVEIGVGENTDYPPGWNEIPGNSEAVLPEETPSYWGEEWEQGTEWNANPYLQPEDPGLRQDPAWGQDGTAQADPYIQEYQDFQWNSGQSYTGSANYVLPVSPALPASVPSPSPMMPPTMPPTMTPTVTPIMTPTMMPTMTPTMTPSVRFSPALGASSLDEKIENETRLCYLKEELPGKKGEEQVRIYIELAAQAPVQVLSLRVNEEEWDWSWDEKGILAEGSSDKDKLSVELLSICEINDKVEISVDAVEK